MNVGKDTTLQKIKEIVLKTASKYGIKVHSIVLYGSRARGDYSFDSDYDCFVLLDDKTSLLQFSQLVSELRMMIYGAGNAKVYSNTIKNFVKIMKKNPFLGSFCYIIATEGLPIHDPNGVYKKIRTEIKKMPAKEQLDQIKRCIEMSKTLGSPKWIEYWQRELRKVQKQ